MVNEKTIQCTKVLQLMDEDFSYEKALNTVLAMYPEIIKSELEIELSKYI